MDSKNPFILFKEWFSFAKAIKKIVLPNCMELSTISESGFPSCRPDFEKDCFTFCTGKNSTKSKNLYLNNKCSLTFVWKEIFNCIRIEGLAYCCDKEYTDKIWKDKRLKDKVMYSASKQSEILEKMENLKEEYMKFYKEYEKGNIVETSENFMCWAGMEDNLHRRIIFERKNDDEDEWKTYNLYP